MKRIVGYLPDNVGFYSDMTGRENLYFTGRLNGLPEDVIRERTENLLERVGMTDAADKKNVREQERTRLFAADMI